ncbi:hypothetical protein HR060_01010 [Catenovulum sp. SM1970]|uniref:hypothetical protein n=1 Tax=Marinifaba aquimaris TaxID=2741323 RepID=UPI001571B4C1|nr:hypothetical protein [Marinifaba aquimaris]NTS75430.1 hypothetical protein [Marinifaba aquimaris]
MTLLKLLSISSLIALTSACATSPTYQIEQAEYSSWAGHGSEKFHYTRKKTILLNTETGETWHLQYHNDNKTRDGYDWERLTPPEQVTRPQTKTDTTDN